jgi:predicted phage-related endonuclease
LYKIIELEQNTSEWLEYRSSHIGGSDAPIICDLSPWKTMEQLYLEKTGFSSKQSFMTAKMQRGHDLEPRARELLNSQVSKTRGCFVDLVDKTGGCFTELVEFQTKNDCNLVENQTIFTPIVVESTTYPFISCSLDGISQCGKFICEIKCPNESTHEDAIIGHIPVYYNVQIQHALMVTGAQYCIYFSYRPEHKIPTAMVKIYPNQELISEILKKEIEFWDRVENLRNPPGMWVLKKK